MLEDQLAFLAAHPSVGRSTQGGLNTGAEPWHMTARCNGAHRGGAAVLRLVCKLLYGSRQPRKERAP